MAPGGSFRRSKKGVNAVIELAREHAMAPDQTTTECSGVPVPAVLLADESAFTAAAERYRRELHVHCYRMLASFDDAEDAVQEAFLRAWRGRDGFDGSALFRAWLYSVATNVCLDMRRRASRH